ncbi:hypothetical protein FQN54_000249 [Arachnomyces sp. PD_36]|nr:hypothetical protein FQN54_000249 [Arachnomyces sp. PD_36]
MGKKKRGHPDLEEILNRPWCYYCERDFDDLKILISHQKAKHFKCERCGRRLNTAGGLSVHMSQVHKESLTEVDNALPNRSSLDIEIFGMEGVPEDIVQAHNQRVLTQFHQAEADRRAVTGNPPPGTAGANQSKKPKLEKPSDLKKRLAEHKAKLAEQASGGSSGDVTPVGAGQSMQTPGGYVSVCPFYLSVYSRANEVVKAQSSQYPAAQQPFNGAAANQQFSYPQSYGQASTQYPQGTTPGSFQKPAEFPAAPYNQYPAGGQQFQGAQYSPTGTSQQQYQAAPSNLPPRNFGTASPHLPYQPQQPTRLQTPPQTATSISPPPGGLPAAPGLPSRPSFGAPPVNAFQMQQLHHGRVSSQSPGATPASQNGHGYQGAETANQPLAASVNDLVSGAARAADSQNSPAAKPEGVSEEKPSKKEKEKAKATRLVFSDNETSPEEKMAKLPRYAFVPDKKAETVLGDAATAAVAGIPTGSDDVIDRTE